jgi:hypothetical protein
MRLAAVEKALTREPMDTEKANKALRAAMRKMTMQRAVNTMRDVLKKLEEFECTPEDIKGMTWSKARWEAKGGREDHEHEDWIGSRGG